MLMHMLVYMRISNSSNVHGITGMVTWILSLPSLHTATKTFKERELQSTRVFKTYACTLHAVRLFFWTLRTVASKILDAI